MPIAAVWMLADSIGSEWNTAVAFERFRSTLVSSFVFHSTKHFERNQMFWLNLTIFQSKFDHLLAGIGDVLHVDLTNFDLNKTKIWDKHSSVVLITMYLHDAHISFNFCQTAILFGASKHIDLGTVVFNLHHQSQHIEIIRWRQWSLKLAENTTNVVTNNRATKATYVIVFKVFTSFDVNAGVCLKPELNSDLISTVGS